MRNFVLVAAAIVGGCTGAAVPQAGDEQGPDAGVSTSTQDPDAATVTAILPPDAGARDPGAPDAGLLADAGGNGAAACPITTVPPPPPACPVPPDTSNAACRTLIPDDPIQFLDGGIPGACDEQQFDPNTSALVAHTVQRFDSSGRLLSRTVLDAAGNVIGDEIVNRYDACGRLVYTSTKSTTPSPVITAQEDDYGADGLLARRVSQTAFTGDPDAGCSVQLLAYQFDDGGQPVAAYDAVTCAPVQTFAFDALGRLSADQVFARDIVNRVFKREDYVYFTDGGVQQHNSNFSGYHDDRTFDATGAVVVITTGEDSAGFALDTTYFKYSPDDHRLLETGRGRTASGRCNSFDRSDVFNYDDAGVLLSDVETFDPIAVGPCGQVTTAMTSYTHPSPSVQVADEPGADGGTARKTRTTFDARGNVVKVETAAPPDFTFRTVLIRGYDCFNQ